MYTVRSHNLCIALVCAVFFVSSVYAICEHPVVLDQAYTYVDNEETCDGFYPGLSPQNGGCTLCCKNWLSCTSFNGTAGICREIPQGLNCTRNAECHSSATGLTCMKTSPLKLYGKCQYTGALASGESCLYDDQCQSGTCGEAPAGPPEGLRSGVLSSPSFNGYVRAEDWTPTGVCSPEAKEAGHTCSSQGDCAKGTWCNPTTMKCTESIAMNGNCTEGSDVPFPNYVCASGSGCMKTSEGATCVSYYSQKSKSSICTLQNWWNCEYGYWCSAADSTTEGTCQSPQMNKNIGDSCYALPFSADDYDECPWGGGCNCFTSTQQNSKGSCQRIYNTNCEDQLNDFVKCIKNAGCPHNPIPLIGYGSPSDPSNSKFYTSSPFAGTIIEGSCAFENCLKKHGSLLNCQNDTPRKSYTPARQPNTYPNNVYDNNSSGLAGWEIGLIIVSIAVAVIIIVVVVVAVVRRKKHQPGYESLH